MDPASASVQHRLLRLLWLSVAAALLTITLKTIAWRLTGSVGLLSDAAESLVNLVTALVALAAFRWASKPADEEHTFGHAKAEYFSAGVEGALIFVVAVVIGAAAVDRLIDPQPVQDVGIGLSVSAVASAINLAVGLLLLRAGRTHRSLILEADGRHLLTDVWTSVGVIAGVGSVVLTGWERLDALVAIAVAANIVVAGAGLVRRSAEGLMDRALSEGELQRIGSVIDSFREAGVDFHALRSRQAGQRAFVSTHVLVPGEWTVQQGHDLLERFEAALRAELPYLSVFTHLEPAEDPRSFTDTVLSGESAPPADP